MSVDVAPNTSPRPAAAPIGLPDAVQSLIERLRGRIRSYLLVQGLAVTAVCLGLLFWATLAFDWLFEPPVAVRAIVMFFAAWFVMAVVWNLVIRPLRHPLEDRSLALMLERRYGRFHDGLITVVELSGEPAHRSVFNQAMLAHTSEQARRCAGGVDLDQMFDPAPRRRDVGIAGSVLLSLLILAVLWPSAYGMWGRRMVAFSSVPWPRDTRLVIEGFENGVAKVARGGDLDVVVLADTSGAVPRTVQLRYRVEDGLRRRVNMSREGDALTGGEAYQRFNHPFQDVLSPIRFDVYGGDARLRDLRVEVVESPTLTELEVDCQFPEYLAMSPRTLPVAGAVEVPQGTLVVLRGLANKDLVRIRVDPPADQAADAVPASIIQLPDEDDPRRFLLDLGRLDEDRVLLFTLYDTDGIESLEPLRLVLLAMPDKPPALSVRPVGIGSAITPRARIPFAGEIRDDYALDRCWFEYTAGDAEPREQQFAAATRGRPEHGVDETFEASDLGLSPGEQLSLWLKAKDNYAEGDRENIGSSERFLLDVVTPEALLAMLASRELNLRRRFESLIAEVTETRDSLARFAQESAAPAGEEDAEKDGEESATPNDDDEADAVDDATDDDEDTATERLGVERLRVDRALQNTRKNASETSGLAESFADIEAELVNNRVDTEELRQRLEIGIIQPLELIADPMFPELERRLEALQAAIGQRDATRTASAAAQRQADEILTTMHGVLEKMLELETFNELLELLREIIDAQDRVNEKTRDLRRQQLRDFLE